MRPFVILQAGNPPSAIRQQFGSFAQMFQGVLGVAAPVRVVRCYAGEPLPALRDVAAVLITGSPANVTDDTPWMRVLVPWLSQAVEREVPTLGVCFGHQILAHALGGTVGYHPRGREAGTQSICLTEAAAGDAWLAGLPARFAAQLVHEQTVLRPPPGAQVLGYNDHDACQILRLAPHAVSVQFHPEFSADIMRAYLVTMAAKLEAEGLQPHRLHAQVRDTPEARGLVERFVRHHAASACSSTS